MSAALRPYPKYRDSGLSWLAQVPSHWQAVRNGRLFSERNETGFPSLPILEVSLRTGVRVRDMNGGRKQQMADRTKYKRAAEGDIAYNIMRMWQGAVGIAPCDGLISPAYVVANPLNSVDARFYVYLFRTSAYMREVEFASRGIVPDRNRLYWQYFKPLLSPVPPPAEQRRIADFLDAYTGQVHRLIAARRRTIALLIERKQAIIEESLGVGVEQMSATICHAEIGEIPEHWRVARIKDWCDVNARTLPDSTQGDYSFDYFDISIVGTGVLTGEPQAMTFDVAPSRARRRLEPNDILLSTVRTYLKAIYFFQGWPREAIASTGFAVLTPKAGVLPELFSYALMTPRFIDVVISRSVGVAYPAIAETRLAALHLALPPDESEQHLILNAIKEDTKLVDEAIAAAEETGGGDQDDGRNPSSSSAWGPLQFQPGAHLSEAQKISNRNDVAQTIPAGAQVLHDDLLAYPNDLNKALRYYNNGWRGADYGMVSAQKWPSLGNQLLPYDQSVQKHLNNVTNDRTNCGS